MQKNHPPSAKIPALIIPLLAILFILLCSSCSLASPATPPPPSSSPSGTASPIPPTITPSPSPSLSPTSTSTLTPTPPPFVLHPDNVRDLFLVARLDRSQLESVSWSPDGRTLLVSADMMKMDYFDMQTFSLIRSVNMDTALNANSCPSCAGGWTTSAAFSPSGDIVASASGGRAVIWDPLTGDLRYPLQDAPDLIEKIVFSPNGSFLASPVGAIVIWDVHTSRIVHTLSDPGMSASHITFSPDSSTLVSVDALGVIRIWDVTTEKLFKKVDAPGRTWAVAFHPGGQYFATGGQDNQVILWDLQGNLIRQFQGKPHWTSWDEIASITFNPAGDLIAAGTQKGKLQVFDAATGEQLDDIDAADDPAKIASVAFSPDGQFLAAAYEIRSARIWATRALAARLPRPTPISDPAIVSNYQSLPSGEYIAFSEGTGMQFLSTDGEIRAPFTPSFTGFPISADGRIFEHSAEQASSLDLLTGSTTNYPNDGFLSPNGDWLAASGICNGKAGINLTRTDHTDSFCFSVGVDLPNESGVVDEHIAMIPWSPDGSSFAYLRITATVPRSGTIPPWSPYTTDGLYLVDSSCLPNRDTCAKSIRFAAHYPGKLSTWTNARWSPDGSLVVVGDNEKFVVFSPLTGRTWSLAINQKTDPYSFVDFAISPDSNWIYYSGSGTNILKQSINSNAFTEVVDGLQKARVLGVVMAPLLKPAAAFTILPPGDALALRSDPGLASQVLARLHTGDHFTVLEGPVCLDGYTWWRIQPETTSASGWVREFYNWFAPTK